jgi:hypothetical protein
VGGLLVAGAGLLIVTNTKQIHEITIFAAVLMLQSLPFLSAAGMAAIEGSRLNEFAYWKALENRLLVLWPKRAVAIANAATTPAEKQPETIQ